jgi:hypothetical protein
MAYSKKTWKDRMVEKPLTFTQVNNPGGTITLTPAEGAIVEPGTPISAANMNNIENGVGDVDTRLTAVEGKYAAGPQPGILIDAYTAFLFTNGSSDTATANVAFSKAFTTPPSVAPANIIQSASYADVIRYPYIYNVTTLGFSVKITTQGSGNLGTVGSPVNMLLNFLVLGK